MLSKSGHQHWNYPCYCSRKSSVEYWSRHRIMKNERSFNKNKVIEILSKIVWYLTRIYNCKSWGTTERKVISESRAIKTRPSKIPKATLENNWKHCLTLWKDCVKSCRNGRLLSIHGNAKYYQQTDNSACTVIWNDKLTRWGTFILIVQLVWQEKADLLVKLWI